SAFDHPSLRRLAGMGVFLSVIAAVITTESVTRLARPFGVRHFLATVVLIGAALFPSLADWHRVRLGLAPEQFAVLQSYCYLALLLGHRLDLQGAELARDLAHRAGLVHQILARPEADEIPPQPFQGELPLHP